MASYLPHAGTRGHVAPRRSRGVTRGHAGHVGSRGVTRGRAGSHEDTCDHVRSRAITCDHVRSRAITCDHVDTYHSKEDERRKSTHAVESAAFSTVSWCWPRVSRPELRTRMSRATWIVDAWKRRKCVPSSPSSCTSLVRMPKTWPKISSVRPTVRLSQSAAIETMPATSADCRLEIGTSSRHSITITLRSSSGTSSVEKSTCRSGVGRVP
eukprot:2471086-Prymnesium_polylepis.1